MEYYKITYTHPFYEKRNSHYVYGAELANSIYQQIYEDLSRFKNAKELRDGLRQEYVKQLPERLKKIQYNEQ